MYKKYSTDVFNSLGNLALLLLWDQIKLTLLYNMSNYSSKIYPPSSQFTYSQLSLQFVALKCYYQCIQNRQTNRQRVLYSLMGDQSTKRIISIPTQSNFLTWSIRIYSFCLCSTYRTLSKRCLLVMIRHSCFPETKEFKLLWLPKGQRWIASIILPASI